jgi:endonuclease/exonuclease/phosphatase family metal-dependent hydrolase
MRTSFNVCTYNLMLTVPEPVKMNGQYRRAKQIVNSIFNQIITPYNLDAIILTELICYRSRRLIIKHLHNIGWKQHTSTLGNSLVMNFIPKIASGGVMIFTKYQIIKEKQFIFPESCHTDKLASKGIVYAQIQKNNNLIHVFATHLQAWNDKKANQIREKQLQYIKKFIRLQYIPKNHIVILGGDFNINYNSEQYKILHNIIHLSDQKLPITDQQYTIDPLLNKLVGNDDMSQYVSDAFPNACWDTYKNTLQCECCTSERLDYNFVCLDYLNPINSKHIILPIKVNKYLTYLNWKTKRYIDDLSDHFPVVSVFTFNKGSEHQFKYTKNIKNTIDYDLVILVLCILLVLFIFNICYYLLKMIIKTS